MPLPYHAISLLGPFQHPRCRTQPCRPALAHTLPHRRRRRIRKPSVIGSLLVPHPLWKALPPPAAAAVADIQPLLEPVLVPRVSATALCASPRCAVTLTSTRPRCQRGPRAALTSTFVTTFLRHRPCLLPCAGARPRDHHPADFQSTGTMVSVAFYPSCNHRFLITWPPPSCSLPPRRTSCWPWASKSEPGGMRVRAAGCCNTVVWICERVGAFIHRFHAAVWFDPAPHPPMPFHSHHSSPCPSPCSSPRRYAYDWARIRAQLLPTKSEQQLFHRKKNRVAGNAPDNCVKVGSSCAARCHCQKKDG